MSENPMKIALQVAEECGINTLEDLGTYMSVIKEHCLDKDITDAETMKKTWIEFKNSLKKAAKKVKGK